MKRTGIFVAALLASAFVAGAGTADAFCGFYVGGADAKLFNNATQVVMMRDGTRTVLSMQNDYQGPPDGFAMVVPVPVILQKENVKTLDKEVFERVDRLTSPRLVEYWEQDPCQPPQPQMEMKALPMSAPAPQGGATRAADLGVTVEAKFSVGEYEIVILSAKDAGGLDTWLRQQKYKIPEGAEPYLKPYVQSGSKFFVAKVDATKVKMVDGHAALSPLRFHYDSSDFTLPVRLGLINSAGTQDLIVNILAQNQRYEPANYPSVTIPTNMDVAEEAKQTFGSFYASLFDETLKKNNGAVVTEYAWDASTCDPCPGPALKPSDIVTLGADALPNSAPPQATARVAPQATGPSQNYARSFQWSAQQCWAQTLAAKPKTKGGLVETKVTAKKGGGVTVAVVKNETGDAELGKCMKQAAEKGLSRVGTDLTLPIILGSASPPRMFGWTITRLHARYTKDALGADLSFRAAKPITGGREVRGPLGELEHGSTQASVNNFQGRYAIRHAWTGPIACANPVRGVWGGPPSGGSMPIAAEKVAFAARGGNLVSFLRSDVPELGITGVPKTLLAQATPTPSASALPMPPPVDAGPPALPQAEHAPSGCGGCTTTTTNAATAWWSLSLPLIALVARSRRRR